MDDKKKGSISEKLKEGVSVHEIETFARKYTIEAFLILALIIATISSIFDFFTGPGWSLVFGGLGAIASIAFPEQVIKIEKKLFKIVTRKEKSAQIAVGIVRIVIALFLPFIIFAEIGLLAGSAFHHFSHQMHDGETIAKEEKKEEKEEEEHL